MKPCYICNGKLIFYVTTKESKQYYKLRTQDNLTIDAIALRFKRSPSIVRKHLDYYGVDKRKNSDPWSDEMTKYLTTAKANGKSYSVIGREMTKIFQRKLTRAAIAGKVRRMKGYKDG